MLILGRQYPSVKKISISRCYQQQNRWFSFSSSRTKLSRFKEPVLYLIWVSQQILHAANKCQSNSGNAQYVCWLNLNMSWRRKRTSIINVNDNLEIMDLQTRDGGIPSLWTVYQFDKRKTNYLPLWPSEDRSKMLSLQRCHLNTLNILRRVFIKRWAVLPFISSGFTTLILTRTTASYRY